MPALNELFRRFINRQIKISNQFNRLVIPAKFNIDGYNDFSSLIIPNYLGENLVIYDIQEAKIHI